MNFRVAILYAPDGRRPLRVVELEDQGLLATVAKAAIREADLKAAKLARHDAVLGIVEREESARIRRVLEALLPRDNSATPVLM
jgi:hypothetical protein